METTVTSQFDAYQNVHDLRVKEGQRVMTIMASMEDGLLKFDYYSIKKWEYPFDEDAFTEEDRARLTTRIIDHYTAQGWRVEVDRRRFCPRCYERLAGSDRQDWLGGTCDFCGKEIDRYGNIIFF
jgi:hypothetical protein